MNNLFGMNNNNHGNNFYNNGYVPNVIDTMRSMYGQPRNQIQWVLGIENAKSYPMSPNSTVLLMDSEQPKFYIKTSDQHNMCTIKSYDFCESKETQTPPAIDMENYITKDSLIKVLESANFITKEEVTNLINETIAATKTKTLI